MLKQRGKSVVGVPFARGPSAPKCVCKCVRVLPLVPASSCAPAGGAVAEGTELAGQGRMVGGQLSPCKCHGGARLWLPPPAPALCWLRSGRCRCTT